MAQDVVTKNKGLYRGYAQRHPWRALAQRFVERPWHPINCWRHGYMNQGRQRKIDRPHWEVRVPIAASEERFTNSRKPSKLLGQSNHAWSLLLLRRRGHWLSPGLICLCGTTVEQRPGQTEFCPLRFLTRKGFLWHMNRLPAHRCAKTQSGIFCSRFITSYPSSARVEPPILQ